MRIALYGPIGSGKTTTARAMLKLFPDVGFRLAFADQIKAELSRALATPSLPAKQILEEMNDPVLKTKWRRALQLWGTDIRRNLFGPNYWVDSVADLIDNMDGLNIVIDDLRFDNEREMLASRGFVFVRLYGRPGTEHAVVHESESEWLKWKPDLRSPWGTEPEVRAALILEAVGALHAAEEAR